MLLIKYLNKYLNYYIHLNILFLLTIYIRYFFIHFEFLRKCAF